MQRPCLSHYSAAQRVLRYLRTDPLQGVLLSSHPSFDLLAFCDADWATCRDSRRSMSGFFITLGGAPISWKSKKQASITLSSAEAIPFWFNISLFFVPSDCQLADLFTKPLSGGSHRHILSKLGVYSLPSILRGDVEDKNPRVDSKNDSQNNEEVREKKK
ncbi:secreted RxLR effector protein 161-like [Nicotiana sylvestris]|uniref:secreted RxLR effector protein 161-like n=1 Tax=Nicotiana sylvestris TaxID=4096 RepID=UPI00388C3CC0